MTSWRSRRSSGGWRPVLVIVVVIWLVVGLIAAAQRHYFRGSKQTCAKAGTIAVTIVAGPLNYVGANPKVKNCDLPKPSK